MFQKRIDLNLVRVLKERVDILEVVSPFTSLVAQGGDEHLGLCPFHNEKSPSFRVNSSKKVYFCFGCQEKGDAITFVMNAHGVNFFEALEILAHQYNIPEEIIYTPQDSETEITTDWQLEQKKKKELIAINELACHWFQNNLNQAINDQNNNPVKEFLQGRSLEIKKIPQFRLGYGGKDWQGLIKYFLDKSPESPDRVLERLLEAGVIKKNDNGKYYDAFYDRLLVPLFDARGKVVGFSGRRLQDTNNNTAKYLNSCDSLVFKKKEIIFPLHLASKSIKQSNAAIIVEGNFDVIQLHKIGISNAIATLGTSLSDKQLKKIISLTSSKTIILALDNDSAGVKAIAKIIKDNLNLINSNGVDFKVASPGNYKDWDEFSRANSPEVVGQFIENNAVTWIDWYINQICKNQDLTNSDCFTKTNHKLSTLLSWLTDSNLQRYFSRKCAEILAKAEKTDCSQDIILNYQQGLIQNARNLVSNDTSPQNRPPVNVLSSSSIYNGLDDKEITVLCCEITLAKIALFHPNLTTTIDFCLKEFDWFIRDALARWVIRNSLILQNEQIEREYLIQQIKITAHDTINDSEKFIDTPEFINLNYQKDNRLLNAKLTEICSQDPAGLIAIENPDEKVLAISKKLKLTKIQEQIAICQNFLIIAKNTEEKIYYLQQINDFKKQINQLVSSD